jgi:hypothetical protein
VNPPPLPYPSSPLPLCLSHSCSVPIDLSSNQGPFWPPPPPQFVFFPLSAPPGGAALPPSGTAAPYPRASSTKNQALFGTAAPSATSQPHTVVSCPFCHALSFFSPASRLFLSVWRPRGGRVVAAAAACCRCAPPTRRHGAEREERASIHTHTHTHNSLPRETLQARVKKNNNNNKSIDRRLAQAREEREPLTRFDARAPPFHQPWTRSTTPSSWARASRSASSRASCP